MLCLSLLVGSILILPKQANAQEVVPFAVVYEKSINTTKSISVSANGQKNESYQVKLSGRFLYTKNPFSVQNWQVSVSGVGSKSYYMIGAETHDGSYTVTVLGHSYSATSSGVQVTINLKVQHYAGGAPQYTSRQVYINV